MSIVLLLGRDETGELCGSSGVGADCELGGRKGNAEDEGDAEMAAISFSSVGFDWTNVVIFLGWAINRGVTTSLLSSSSSFSIASASAAFTIDARCSSGQRRRQSIGAWCASSANTSFSGSLLARSMASSPRNVSVAIARSVSIAIVSQRSGISVGDSFARTARTRDEATAMPCVRRVRDAGGLRVRAACGVRAYPGAGPTALPHTPRKRLAARSARENHGCPTRCARVSRAPSTMERAARPESVCPRGRADTVRAVGWLRLLPKTVQRTASPMIRWPRVLGSRSYFRDVRARVLREKRPRVVFAARNPSSVRVLRCPWRRQLAGPYKGALVRQRAAVRHLVRARRWLSQ